MIPGAALVVAWWCPGAPLVLPSHARGKRSIIQVRAWGNVGGTVVVSTAPTSFFLRELARGYRNWRSQLKVEIVADYLGIMVAIGYRLVRWQVTTYELLTGPEGLDCSDLELLEKAERSLALFIPPYLHEQEVLCMKHSEVV